MKGEDQCEEEVAFSRPAVTSVLDRNAGIFRGHRARSAKVGTGFASERALNLRVARFPGGRPVSTRPESARARLSRVRALRAPPPAPLTAAPRPQDGRRAIKDGPAFTGGRRTAVSERLLFCPTE